MAPTLAAAAAAKGLVTPAERAKLDAAWAARDEAIQVDDYAPADYPSTSKPAPERAASRRTALLSQSARTWSVEPAPRSHGPRPRAGSLRFEDGRGRESRNVGQGFVGIRIPFSTPPPEDETSRGSRRGLAGPGRQFTP